MTSPLSAVISNASSALQNPNGDPASVVHSFLQGEPVFQTNRERAAAVLDAGFKIYDTYAKARPYIFYGSLAMLALSGVALYKRRSRGTEAIALWMFTMAASATAAWVTRPPSMVAAPDGASAETQSTFSVLGEIDARRAALKAKDPQFADKVFQRFDALPVVAANLAQAPALKAVIS